MAWSEGNFCIAEPNLEVLPLIICFIMVSLLPSEEGQKNIHGTVLIYEKVNEYYLFLNQGLSNSVIIRKNKRPNVKS